MVTHEESGEIPRSSNKLESGNWEGEYIDVNGYRGRLSINLKAEGGVLRGAYELTLRTEDAPQILKGVVEGKVDEKGSVSMNLAPGNTVDKQGAAKTDVPMGGGNETMEFNAQTSSAGSFALQALCGLVSGAPQSNFGGGVWIAWRFNKPEEKGDNYA